MRGMKIQTIDRDIHVFVGEELESVATAIEHEGKVLLVDALASREDACALRDHLARNGQRVHQIVLTHAMNDHMAGLRVFGDVDVVAHRFHQHTFLSQQPEDIAAYRAYVPPTLQIQDETSIRWGRHELHLLHNPGKTMDMLAIDIPTADAVIVGDTIVGNTAYLSRAAPDMIDLAIGRLIDRQRSTVIPGHMGVMGHEALINARHYLKRLRNQVAAIPRDGGFASAVRRIAIESCVAPTVQATAFECHWHLRNLDVIVEQKVLELDAVRSGTTQTQPA
jgi:cyclase